MKLVKTFEAKLKYELNSSVYQVASLLLTNKLKTLFDRDDCQLNYQKIRYIIIFTYDLSR
jgi:hypothetical protein